MTKITITILNRVATIFSNGRNNSSIELGHWGTTGIYRVLFFCGLHFLYLDLVILVLISSILKCL